MKLITNSNTDYINKEIGYHMLLSGEIFVSLATEIDMYQPYEEIFSELFSLSDIKTSYPDEFEEQLTSNHFSEISKEQAAQELKTAFSIKPNYTAYKIPINELKIKDLSKVFFDTFRLNPKYYKVFCVPHKKDFPTGDFWESNGVLIIDDKYAGILWVNDLYDYYEKP